MERATRGDKEANHKGFKNSYDAPIRMSVRISPKAPWRLAQASQKLAQATQRLAQASQRLARATQRLAQASQRLALACLSKAGPGPPEASSGPADDCHSMVDGWMDGWDIRFPLCTTGLHPLLFPPGPLYGGDIPS